jgi:hypothetical protein
MPFLLSFLVFSIAIVSLQTFFAGKQRRLANQLESLRQTRIQPIRRERDFLLQRRLLTFRIDASVTPLDPQTWHELDLDDIYALVDRTYSSLGECELFRLLNTPETEIAVLEQRARLIEHLESNPPLQDSVGLTLTRLGRTSSLYGVHTLLWEEPPQRSRFATLYSFLGYFFIATAALAVAGSVAGLSISGFVWIGLGLLYFANTLVHYHTRHLLGAHLYAMRYLCDLIAAAHKLAGIVAPALRDIQADLLRDANVLDGMLKATKAIMPERGGAVEFLEAAHDYLAIATLTDVRSYYRALAEAARHQPALRRLFKGVGELDALCSVASFRNGLTSYTKPTFSTSDKTLRVDGMVHPLLARAVANSLTLGARGCLIGGANMSGKSTFLRTIGVNIVLAQTICTCTAVRYVGSLFRLMSSIRPEDSLIEGKSFYYSEVMRLLQMVRNSDGSLTTVCLIDELLRGTNLRERAAASEAILRYLSKRNVFVIAATHDAELVGRLDGLYDSYHFCDSCDHNDVHFDYTLRPGAATTSNAIRLLECLQFPDEITSYARSKLREAFS